VWRIQSGQVPVADNQGVGNRFCVWRPFSNYPCEVRLIVMGQTATGFDASKPTI
jgi:hypothetical protein